MTPRQFKRKRQSGFIQNLIIPGLLLLGAVVAVIALMSNSSSGTDTTKEQASLYTASILTQGVTMKEAAQRALADGVSASDLDADAATPGTLQVLLDNKYIASGALPTPPKGAEATGTTPAWVFVVRRTKDAAGNDLNTAAADEVLMMANLNRDVCLRINNKLYGETVIKANDAAMGTALAATIAAPTVTLAANQAGVAEGCVKGDSTYTNYVYYKVVNQK